MNHKLLTLLILFSSFSYAENINITIPSTTTPEGISLQKYNELRLEHKRKVADKTIDHRLVGAKVAAAEKAKRDAAAQDRLKAAAQQVHEEAATRKAEINKIASSTKRDFKNKVRNAWRMPINSRGQKATAWINLSESGTVISVVVNASNPDVKESIEKAVRDAAPYPMPSDPEVRRQARTFTASFTVK